MTKFRAPTISALGVETTQKKARFSPGEREGCGIVIVFFFVVVLTVRQNPDERTLTNFPLCLFLFRQAQGMLGRSANVTAFLSTGARHSPGPWSVPGWHGFYSMVRLWERGRETRLGEGGGGGGLKLAVNLLTFCQNAVGAQYPNSMEVNWIWLPTHQAWGSLCFRFVCFHRWQFLLNHPFIAGFLWEHSVRSFGSQRGTFLFFLKADLKNPLLNIK